MIRHVWSVLCTKSSIDTETNNVSLFEVIEQLELQFPGTSAPPRGVPLELELLTLWARQDPATPVTGEMRIRLLSPQGKELAAFTAGVDLGSAPRNRHRARLNGLVLDGSGWYEWEVSSRADPSKGWDVQVLIPLDISLTTAAAPQSAAS